MVDPVLRDHSLRLNGRWSLTSESYTRPLGCNFEMYYHSTEGSEVMMKQLVGELQTIESYYPNKKRIRLTDAKQFIQKIAGFTVEDDMVRQFLKEKGYIKIEEDANDVDDSLNLDDILDMDWEPKRYPDSNENKSDGYANNAILLNEFHKHKDSISFARLVNDNIGLVRKIVNKYMNYIDHRLDYDDLVSEGILGLIKAIEKFDVSKEVRFSTYAYWWIFQRIVRAMFETGTTVRIPVHMVETLLKVKKAEPPYLSDTKPVNVTEICNQLDISVSTYEQAKLVEHQFLNITSLDQYVSDEQQDTQLGEFVSVDTHLVAGVDSYDFADPVLMTERRDIRTRLQGMLSNHLKQREKEIIIERFGLRDDEPKTLEQIGQSFGVTRERIRQIEAKALRKLRRNICRKTKRDDWQWPESSIEV